MKGAQSFSNAQKYFTGQEVKDDVHQLLTLLLKRRLILHFESDLNYTHKQFSYEKQFKCDFVVTTIDEKYILIRASNSYRSDRVKIPFYDFLGIQNFSNFAGNIVASILLFPDGEELNTTFISTRQKVYDGSFFSPASHWLTFSELDLFFANYCAEAESYLVDEDVVDEDVDDKFSFTSRQDSGGVLNYPRTFSTTQSAVIEKSGSYFGRSGNQLERYLVEEINAHDNLKSYQEHVAGCYEFNEFLDYLVETYEIDRKEIHKLEATDTILKLKNGGSPKTDIHMRLYTSPTAFYPVNISVKNTTASRVSCHDYEAKDFIRVIAPSDELFATVLQTFQDTGSWKDYHEDLANRGIELDTDAILGRYMKDIILWAITGKNDVEQILDKDTQIVDAILTRNADTGVCKVQSARDYINELNSMIGSGQGSPFSWTYPSKRRGQRIQLKMPIKLPQD